MAAVRYLLAFWVVSAVSVAGEQTGRAVAGEPAAATAPEEPKPPSIDPPPPSEPGPASPIAPSSEPAPPPPEPSPPTEIAPSPAPAPTDPSAPAETVPAPGSEAPTPPAPEAAAMTADLPSLPAPERPMLAAAPAPPIAIVASSQSPAFGRGFEVQRLDDIRVSPRAHRFGIALDAGLSGMLPDVGALFVYRPLTWMRAAAGVGHNLVRPGVKASVSLVNPLWFPLSLTGELGHFFEGNVNDALKRFAGQDTNLAVLERVSYQFANALLGLELGSRRATFYIRGGVTAMRMNLKNFDQIVKDAVKDDRARSSEPRLSYRGPTAKLGLVVYF
jgi:hypothetical protein